jgi:hypothetical protein
LRLTIERISMTPMIVPVPISRRSLGVPMMKNRTAVVASLLAFVLAVAPAPAFAGERYHGGHHGGGLIWGFANAVVATAVAVITAPVAILAAVAQAPRYYAPGPAYAGPSPVYDTPAAGPRYYGRPAAPAYYGAPQTAPYYATAPADYTSPAATYYTAPPNPAYYAPRVAARSNVLPAGARYDAALQVFSEPPPDYRPRYTYYAPPPGANYYPR